MLRNRARCRRCNTVIESKHRHDFVVCDCWGEDENGVHRGIAVDGGPDYSRRLGNPADIDEMPGEVTP